MTKGITFDSSKRFTTTKTKRQNIMLVEITDSTRFYRFDNQDDQQRFYYLWGGRKVENNGNYFVLL